MHTHVILRNEVTKNLKNSSQNREISGQILRVAQDDNAFCSALFMFHSAN